MRNISAYLCFLLCFAVPVLSIDSSTCIDIRSYTGTCVPEYECIGMNFYPLDSGLSCGGTGLVCCVTRVRRQINPDFLMPLRNIKFPLRPNFGSGIVNAGGGRKNRDKIIFGPIRAMQQNPISAPTETPAMPPEEHVPDTSSETANCGISQAFVNRVVGGSEAKKGSYPWIAALGYSIAGHTQYLCSGSLISPRHVLTSAHCIDESLKLVRLGAHDLSKQSEPTARNYYIKRVVVHEEYEAISVKNDMAVVEMTEAVKMTTYINTICLPESAESQNEDYEGKNPFVAGWGARKFQGPQNYVLHDVQVPIVNSDSCVNSYRGLNDLSGVKDRVICAGNSRVDSCHGDSGGPMMMPEFKDSKYRYNLIGVVSFGYECAKTGYPGIYSKVSAYMPWIKNATS